MILSKAARKKMEERGLTEEELFQETVREYEAASNSVTISAMPSRSRTQSEKDSKEESRKNIKK